MRILSPVGGRYATAATVGCMTFEQAADRIPEQPAAETDDARAAQWLAWVREVRALARAGLTYSSSPFDLERYTRLEEISTEMQASLAQVPAARIAMIFSGEPGYVTPKLDLRAAVHDDAGRLLLVRETHDGRWAMPGGWADVNESLAEGVVREVVEESGYVVEVDRLLGVYERERWGHPPMPSFTLKAVVACRLTGGSPATSHETDGVEWFPRDGIPPLSTGRTSPELVRRVFEHFDDPALPPDLS